MVTGQICMEDDWKGNHYINKNNAKNIQYIRQGTYITAKAHMHFTYILRQRWMYINYHSK
jgi:hypothetical protein